MARYRDAKCRLCRREGMKLFLKGARCFTDKCAIERRNYPPGQHGLNRGKLTAFGVQLREKTKLQARIDDNVNAGRGQVPQWLELDPNEKKGVVRSLPLRDDIQIPVAEQLIVELYSK